MTRRMARVNVLLRQEISRVLATELKDPRLPVLMSVTRVDAAPDVRSAKVYVSVMGGAEEKASALKALRSASGFVRRSLRKTTSLRNLPSIDFRLDESIERGAEVLKLIGEAAAPAPEEPEAS